MRVLFVLTCLSLAASFASAQAPATDSDMEKAFAMARGFMVEERDLMLAEELELTPAQERAFRPIYQAYRADIERVQDRSARLIAEYAAHYQDLSDEMANALVDDYFSIQLDMLATRQRHLTDFRKVLPAQTVARFYQIENKIDAVALVLLTREIPLVGATE
jgi:Spy/CpxP family protein refolding chaperone